MPTIEVGTVSQQWKQTEALWKALHWWIGKLCWAHIGSEHTVTFLELAVDFELTTGERLPDVSDRRIQPPTMRKTKTTTAREILPPSEAQSGLCLYFDGGSRQNGTALAVAGAGAVVYEDGKKIAEVIVPLGRTTNNVAEFSALVGGLHLLGEQPPSVQGPVTVRGDSKVVISTMKKTAQCKPILRPYLLQATASMGALAPRFSFNLEHVARDRNTDADALSNAAMDQVQAQTSGETLKGRVGAYERLVEQLGWAGARVRIKKGVAHIEATEPPPVAKVRVGEEEGEIVDVEARDRARQEAHRQERIQRTRQEVDSLAAAGPPKRLPDNGAPRGPTYSKPEFLAEFGKKKGEDEWRWALKAHEEVRKRQLTRLREQLKELSPTDDAEMREERREQGNQDETAAAWEAWAQQQSRQREAWQKERTAAREAWEGAFEKRFRSWADAQTQIATKREDNAYMRQIGWMAETEQKLDRITQEMCARIDSALGRIAQVAQQSAAAGVPARTDEPVPAIQPTPPPAEPPVPLAENAAQEPLPAQPLTTASKKGKKAKKEADEKELAEQLKQLNEATKRPVAGKAKGGKGGGKQQLLTDMVSTNRYSPIDKK
ncbi:hypothetical protein DIPPA_20502 [Diplonema papillatum]|nr:hypothetical protein DIPPA_20502 [Diplonema papillatum]